MGRCIKLSRTLATLRVAQSAATPCGGLQLVGARCAPAGGELRPRASSAVLRTAGLARWALEPTPGARRPNPTTPPRAIAIMRVACSVTSVATATAGRLPSAAPAACSCTSTRRISVPATRTAVPTVFRCVASRNKRSTRPGLPLLLHGRAERRRPRRLQLVFDGQQYQ